MPAYYFHCTDGYDLILDRAGCRIPSRQSAELVAYTVAGRVMRTAPGGADWSRWLVTVQDETGSMVTVVPFPAGQA